MRGVFVPATLERGGVVGRDEREVLGVTRFTFLGGHLATRRVDQTVAAVTHLHGVVIGLARRLMCEPWVACLAAVLPFRWSACVKMIRSSAKPLMLG